MHTLRQANHSAGESLMWFLYWIAASIFVAVIFCAIAKEG